MQPSSTAVRIASLGVAACAALAGCVVGEPPAAPVAARALFEARAWPALGRCAGCHASQPSIDFLAPGIAEGAYATMFDYQPPVLDVASPSSSLVLTMGKHTGPELAPAEAAAVLLWLEAERAERVATPPPDPVAVGPLTLQLGAVNEVALPADGARLRFVAADAGGALSLTELQLTAGPRGLRAVHPVLASSPAARLPVLDAADRYRDADLELAPDAAAPLGGGVALLPAFSPADPITIYFRKLEVP